MILYHGTNADFSEVDLRKSKPNKDFGQGFYLSREYTQAMAMAKTKVEQLEKGIPTILTFEADDVAMAGLRVLRFDDYTEEWAKFILLTTITQAHLLINSGKTKGLGNDRELKYENSGGNQGSAWSRRRGRWDDDDE